MPKHVLFSEDVLADPNQQSCSSYIIEYLVHFIHNFNNYCMWESKICFFQLILCGIQWFKMPSMSHRFEEAMIIKEKRRIRRAIRRLMEMAPQKEMQIQ